MPDANNLDLRKALEQSSESATLKDLEARGCQTVKVLDENALQELVARAVDKVVTSQTSDERARILKQSRKELDRLLKEHSAAHTRAELLEANKNDLVERVEALQRELQLKDEIQEEELHRQYQEGTASLQAQVEEVRKQAQALRDENERLRRNGDTSEESRARIAELEEALAAAQEAAQEAQRRRSDIERAAQKEIDALRARGEAAEAELRTRVEEGVRLQEELQRARRDAGAHAALDSKLKELNARLESDEAEVRRLSQEKSQLEGERTRALEELARARREAQEASTRRRRDDADEAEFRRLLAEASRLQGEKGRLEQELARALDAAAAREKALDEERQRSMEGVAAGARLEELRARQQAEAEELKASRTQASHLGADAARLGAQAALADRARAEAVEARAELARLQAVLAEFEKERELQNEKTVIVSSELEQIEEKQKTEQEEFQNLREESARLAEENQDLKRRLEEAVAEAGSLREVLAREQESARAARSETAAAEARLKETQHRSGAVGRELQALRAETEKAKERLAAERAKGREAETRAQAAEGLRGRLKALETMLEEARRSSQRAVRTSLDQSRDVAEMLKKTVSRTKRRAASFRGAALDGEALLESFFRKIKLKELFQKHVPVKVKRAQVHPSETLTQVVEAVVGGDRTREDERKTLRVNVLGPSGGPDVEKLREFLGKLSPQAVRAIGRVHDGLRLHLFRLPARPEPLVFDVTSEDLWLDARTPKRGLYRALVCFDPEGEEFWQGQLRPRGSADGNAVLPFLQACISKVPSPFARSRIRFRMDSRFFGEAIVRFLERRGCSYVIEAPNTAEVRAGARKCPLRPISGGWEVGEFSLRLHPIRKTQARFLVYRRKLTPKEDASPLFRDGAFGYWVLAADPRVGPWRAFLFYQGREEAVGRARRLLRGFSGNDLLGRRRASHAALFQVYLLGLDLLHWFRKRGLPASERDIDLDTLRSERLLLPPMEERGGRTSLPVLPKDDARHRLFQQTAHAIKRLRPVAPFRMGP